MSKGHRKSSKTLQIVEFDDFSLQPQMNDASVIDQNISRDFELPWFNRIEESITADDSVSQVINNQTKLEIVTIQTKIDQCKERQEIELSKLRIQKQEELLALKMDLALANAKLDIESECGSHISQSSSRHRTSKRSVLKTEKHSSPLVNTHTRSLSPIIMDSGENLLKTENQLDHSQNSTDGMLMTVVKELKKPKAQIEKFNGDIMVYKKFLRQFNYVVTCIDSYDEKMNLLEFYTDGEAGMIVSGFGHMESKVGYKAALNELQDRYGDEEAIASAYIDKALAWPKITNSKELDKFAIFLSECEFAVGSMSNIGILDHRDSLKSLVKQLPYNLHDKWGTVVQNIKDRDKLKRAKFNDLVKFVKREARKSNDPTFGREALSDKNKHLSSNTPKKSFTHHKVLTTSVSSNNELKEQLAFQKPCLFCKNTHKLSECRTIQKKPYQERIDCIKSARLCYGCLKPGHSIKNCKSKAKCDSCSRWHPTILHDENFEGKHKQAVTEQITSACSDSTEAGDGVCTMNIIPVVVKLKGSSRTIKTYAFKDNGSSATFCTTNLMNQLGLIGKRKIITINTMGLPYSMTTFVLHNLQIMDLDMKNTIDLPIVYTKDKMPVTHELIPTKHDIAAWDHLKHINLPQINTEIGLLIGNRIADAYTPLEVIISEPHMPHACLTKLGWSVCNLVRSPSPSIRTVNSIIVNRCEVNVVSEMDSLEQLLHKSINFDFPENPISEKLENSSQDKQFLKLVDDSIEKLENGHYQITLPFKSKNVTMPNNYSQAEKRLQSLKYKFQKQPKFKADYVEFMNKIIDNGYAAEISEDESVLRYLANTTTRFQTFVANRIDLIRESSELSQWRHVDSKSNVADDFSRGISTSNKSFNMRWLHGPEFLWKSDKHWPVTNVPTTLPPDDVEVKRSQLIVTATTTEVTSNIMTRLLEYHSSWSKLKTTVAWLLRGMSNLLNIVKKKKDPNMVSKDGKINNPQSKSQFTFLTPDELNIAEDRILMYVQQQYFHNDISNLQNGRKLQSNSKLLKLDPYLKGGLLRVGGRLNRSKLSSDIKNPIILPKDSCVSRLLLQDIHVKVGHLGRNSMLTALRQKYWMLKANTVIRSLVSKCVTCRHYRAKAGEQKMSDLPSDRLIADEKPFTVTGVDYFGPYEIKQGRSIVKRYGVIFTCVRTRAVHIELTYSLDTDACFKVIRRFVNRRGPVKVFKSDNGSNFIATEKELKAEFKKLDFDKLGHLCLNRAIKWEFNPPTASHFGGIWERQIRTIRKILYALFKEQCVRLSDDSLQTLFSEVESIINSRPITRNSDDVNDLSVLTPNNLLLLDNIGSFPLGTFDKKDNFVRRKWRQVQYISDIFWKRWSSEYLVSLQERQKWYFPKRNFSINDIVLLIDNTVSRNAWCLGKVVEVIKDKNNLTRIVKVKSKDNIFKRPIDKLCLLLEADENID